MTAHGLEEDIEDGSTEERRAPFHSNSTDEKGDAIALQHTAEVGTESYMSPEQMERKTYDHKVGQLKAHGICNVVYSILN